MATKIINSLLQVPGKTLQEIDHASGLTTTIKVDDIELGENSIHFYGNAKGQGYRVICIPFATASILVKCGRVLYRTPGMPAIVYTLK